MFRAAISRCTRLVPSAAASSASLSLRNRRAFAASAALHLAPKVTCFFHKDTNTCTYVVEDEETKVCSHSEAANPWTLLGSADFHFFSIRPIPVP